jgi:hypothetical protein
MYRKSAYLMVALTSAFAASAHAETRSVSWQGQAIEANVGQPTRGIEPTKEDLLKMAREAVPATPAYTLPKETKTGQ